MEEVKAEAIKGQKTGILFLDEIDKIAERKEAMDLMFQGRGAKGHFANS